MSYTPTEWENGDIITAEKLNKIENGIVNGRRLIQLNNYDKQINGYQYITGLNPEDFIGAVIEFNNTYTTIVTSTDEGNSSIMLVMPKATSVTSNEYYVSYYFPDTGIISSPQYPD